MLLKFTHLHYKFILSPPAQHKSQKPIEYEWELLNSEGGLMCCDEIFIYVLHTDH